MAVRSDVVPIFIRPLARQREIDSDRSLDRYMQLDASDPTRSFVDLEFALFAPLIVIPNRDPT